MGNKVMVVDDNPAVREVVGDLISAAGFTPVTVAGGKECLERAPIEKPDIILLDINMPDMDGWSVLRALKEKGLTQNCKILMLTATTEIGTDIFGLQDVVEGYIRKPFNNTELTERLRKLLAAESMAPAPAEEKKKEGGLFSRLRTKVGGEGTSELTGMETAKVSEKKYHLKPGFAYLIKEAKPQKSYEIFVDQVTHSIQGLCVTRQHPSVIRKNWGLEKTPIIWLSNQIGKAYINPSNIGILSDTIIRFVEKSGESVVMIDGVEFLILNNDFEKVMKMINHISEAVMEHRSMLLVTVDPRTLSTRELALLERNMEIIEQPSP
jgi:two-component system cell cycle response regulator